MSKQQLQDRTRLRWRGKLEDLGTRGCQQGARGLALEGALEWQTQEALGLDEPLDSLQERAHNEVRSAKGGRISLMAHCAQVPKEASSRCSSKIAWSLIKREDIPQLFPTLVLEKVGQK